MSLLYQKTYNNLLKRNKLISFPNKNLPIIFIIKKKKISQNIQKEYTFYLKNNKFSILKVKQHYILNILKKTQFKQSLLCLHGNLIFFNFNNNNMPLNQHILHFLFFLQNFPLFNNYFHFSLLIDFQQNLLISKTLLNYYSIDYNQLFYINLIKIYKLLFNSLNLISKNLLLILKQNKGDIA